MVADPRHRRGVRHRLIVILGLAVCAVLAGARSFTAIAEWAADADEQTLARLGVSRAVPSESTFRRTLQRLDADAFDDLAGQWAAQRTAPGPGGRRVIAVDGKSLRGSGHGEQNSRHLLAAFGHAHGAVLGQVEVGAKTNEIPMFSALLDRLDIADAVITADALHAQREHATYLARRGAHYLLIVKRNQPGLYAQLAALPWREVPVAYTKRERGHGRTERRTLKVTAVANGLAFPHAAQAIQITRRRKLKGKWSRETCYAVTSLTLAQATTSSSPPSSAATGDRRPPALGTRHGLRRGPLPDPHRQRATHHGQPAQPGHHHPAAGRGGQHRCRPALPRPAPRPATTDDHEVLTEFAEALPTRPCRAECRRRVAGRSATRCSPRAGWAGGHFRSA
jgi:predicted transposase YbfD/YdcC